MIKEIKYGGFTASPSDYESPDGELAALIGLVPDVGNLKPISPPYEKFTLTGGKVVRFIHETADFRHYIILEKSTNNVTWCNEGSTEKPFHSFAGIEIYDINAVGNTIIVLTSTGMHYFLWKTDNYSYLGTHMPECPLSFGLQGSIKESDAFSVSYNESVGYDSSITGANYSDSVKNTVSNQVLAKVNKFIADNYTNGHQFLYPFFVRYAYRLYDGTLSMHSAPILMVCATGQNPYVLGSHSHQTDDGWDGTWNSQQITDCRVYGALYSLDFAVVAQKYIDELKKWSDIITSVDVFISAPLYSYDQSGLCSGTELIKNGKIGGRDEYCVCKATHGGTYSTYYQYHSILAMLFYGKASIPGLSIKLPLKKDSVQKENIKDASQFYFLKSYNIDSLTTERRIVNIEDGYLQSLLNREVMTDDYDSHTDLIAKMSFTYNSRLNVSGLTRILPLGFHMSSMLPYTNGFLQPKNGHLSEGVDKQYEDKQQLSMFIYIKKQGKEIVVRSMDYLQSFMGDFSEAEVGQFTPTPYLYYPDKDAYKAVLFWHKWVSGGDIFSSGEVRVFREIKLEPHPMLNGAVYFKGWETVSGTDVPERNVNKGSDSVVSRSVSIPNKIYTSEVNNPFYFPVLGINTVGTGTILGISTAAKALSQGQFGQFPLYAFTTEGVWALEVSSTGGYSAKQPITRDVCINADSITQLDSAVLFATDRGIMLISGSNSQCISDTLDYSQVFSIDSLPQADKLVTMAGFKAEDFAYVPFRDYLLGCRMIYAYTQQRVIVYNPAHSYAYVYSLKTKTWGMMQSSVADNVPSYPEALAMLKDGTLVDFCTDAAQQQDEDGHLQGIKGLLITRPLKLDAPDLLKTIDTAIQRGNFRKGSIKSALYGSRDLQNWSLIWTSQDHYLRGFRGTPYKYFRFALLCDMQPDESLFGATIQYTPRLLNQPR